MRTGLRPGILPGPVHTDRRQEASTASLRFRKSAVCPLAEQAVVQYIGNMTPHGGYPSDLSEERWELIAPVREAWRAERRGRGLDIGRPPEHDLRQIMNAILYVDRTGIPWRYPAHDFAPWATVYGYFAKRQRDGVFERLTGLLRRLVPAPAGSRSSRDGGPSSAASAGSCTTDASPATTNATRPAPKP